MRLTPGRSFLGLPLETPEPALLGQVISTLRAHLLTVSKTETGFPHLKVVGRDYQWVHCPDGYARDDYRKMVENWEKFQANSDYSLWVVSERYPDHIQSAPGMALFSLDTFIQFLNSRRFPPTGAPGVAAAVRANKGSIQLDLLMLAIEIRRQIEQLKDRMPNAEPEHTQAVDLLKGYGELLRRVEKVEQAVRTWQPENPNTKIEGPIKRLQTGFAAWVAKYASRSGDTGTFALGASILHQAGALNEDTALVAGALASGKMDKAIEAWGKAITQAKQVKQTKRISSPKSDRP